MRPLNSPDLHVRLELLRELKDDTQLNARSRAHLSALYGFWYELWSTHHRIVVLPFYQWRAAQYRAARPAVS